MRWKHYAIAALVLVVAVAGTAYAFRKQLILYFVANVARNATVVKPHQEITWQAGPAQADKPPAERPPNVVFILADDLGINDLSHFGGGVADGLVPTPNIDSIAKDGAYFRNA